MGELQYKNVINRITMIVAEDSQKKKISRYIVFALKKCTTRYKN